VLLATLLNPVPVSPFIAQATIGPCPDSISAYSHSPLTGFGLTFDQGKNGQQYRIQTSTLLSPGSWTDLTSFTYTCPTNIVDASAGTEPAKFYRAISP
jgi:hypothetical protein